MTKTSRRSLVITPPSDVSSGSSISRCSYNQVRIWTEGGRKPSFFLLYTFLRTINQMEPKNHSPEMPRSENAADDTGEEKIKVVDRAGNVKYITRAEYELKKRRRKRVDSHKQFPLKETLSVVFILAVIILAVYLALQIVK